MTLCSACPVVAAARRGVKYRVRWTLGTAAERAAPSNPARDMGSPCGRWRCGAGSCWRVSRATITRPWRRSWTEVRPGGPPVPRRTRWRTSSWLDAGDGDEPVALQDGRAQWAEQLYGRPDLDAFDRRPRLEDRFKAVQTSAGGQLLGRRSPAGTSPCAPVSQAWPAPGHTCSGSPVLAPRLARRTRDPAVRPPVSRPGAHDADPSGPAEQGRHRQHPLPEGKLRPGV